MWINPELTNAINESIRNKIPPFNQNVASAIDIDSE